MSESDERASAPSLDGQSSLDLLVLLFLTALVFSFGFTRELLWDDEHLLRSATALASPLDAFRWHSLGLGEGPRISFWRPLTTLSYFFEARLFGTNPIVFRATNLLLHLASTALVFGVARRFLPRTRQEFPSRLFPLAVALLWAIVPLKAEAVSWISGRADLLGGLVVLAGAELSHRAKTTTRQYLVIGLVATLAPLAKEAYVTAPLFLLLETKRPFEKLLRTAGSYLAILPSLLYVALRVLGPGLGGGGGALLAELGFFDRLALFFETLGVVFTTLAFPFIAIFFRAPIGFTGFGGPDFALEPLPLYGVVGLSSLLFGVTVALRVVSLRTPLLEILVLVLPVANLVPTGIEARFCDRYAYLALLPFLLGLARVLRESGERTERRAALGFGVLAVAAIPLGAHRSYEFARPSVLFSHELARKPPHSMYDEAAFVFTERGEFEAARDAFIGAVKRREELGLPFLLRDALLASRLEQDLSGEQWSEGRAEFARLTACFLERKPGTARFPLRDPFFSFPIPCDDPILEPAAIENRALLEAMRLSLLARSGHPTKSAIEAAFRACPECTLAHADLAQAALALGEPKLALAVLGDEKRELFARLREVARYQESLGGDVSDELERAAKLFVGSAYRPACLLLRSHASEEIPSSLAEAACTLGGVESSPRFALSTSETQRLRTSPHARIEFSRRALASRKR